MAGSVNLQRSTILTDEWQLRTGCYGRDHVLTGNAAWQKMKAVRPKPSLVDADEAYISNLKPLFQLIVHRCISCANQACRNASFSVQSVQSVQFALAAIRLRSRNQAL